MKYETPCCGSLPNRSRLSRFLGRYVEMKQNRTDVGHRRRPALGFDHALDRPDSFDDAFDAVRRYDGIRALELFQEVLDMMGQLSGFFETHHCRQTFEGVETPQEVVEHVG